MFVDLRKTSHILFFVVFLTAVSFGAGWIFAEAIPNAPFWLETLSPLAAYGLLYGAFDAFAWRWRIFRWLGIVTVPDVRGRWLGEQVSSFKDDDGKNRKSRVILEVTQTFSTISAKTYYQNWSSTHTAADLMIIDGEWELVLLFESEPSVKAEESAQFHKGLTRLTQKSSNVLTGTYFNARGVHGELSFRRRGYTLHHEFTIEKKD